MSDQFTTVSCVDSQPSFSNDGPFELNDGDKLTIDTSGCTISSVSLHPNVPSGGKDQPGTSHFGTWNAGDGATDYPDEGRTVCQIAGSSTQVTITDEEQLASGEFRYWFSVVVNCDDEVKTLDPELINKSGN